MNSTNQETEKLETVQPLLIDCEQLARMVGKSKGWVYQNKHKIIGVQWVGGSLRFSRGVICAAIASGRNIVQK